MHCADAIRIQVHRHASRHCPSRNHPDPRRPCRMRYCCVRVVSKSFRLKVGSWDGIHVRFGRDCLVGVNIDRERSFNRQPVPEIVGTRSAPGCSSYRIFAVGFLLVLHALEKSSLRGDVPQGLQTISRAVVFVDDGFYALCGSADSRSALHHVTHGRSDFADVFSHDDGHKKVWRWRRCQAGLIMGTGNHEIKSCYI